MVNRDIWQLLMMKSKFKKAFSNKDRIRGLSREGGFLELGPFRKGAYNRGD